MTRFGIILLPTGKTLSIRIPNASTMEQRKKAYDGYASEYLEVSMVSAGENHKIIPESLVHVPEPMRINTLL